MEVHEIIPELLVEDMGKSVDFYTQVLGFEKEIVFPENEPVFVQLKMDNARIMLYTRKEFENEIPQLKSEKMGGSFLLYFNVKGLEDYYKKIKDKVEIVQDFHQTEYGKKELCFKDVNGYFITMAE